MILVYARKRTQDGSLCKRTLYQFATTACQSHQIHGPGSEQEKKTEVTDLDSNPNKRHFISRQESSKPDDDVDDLFGGLDDLRPSAASSRKSKTDFMSDLFGGSGGGGRDSNLGQNKGKEFVLDDKYRKLPDKAAEISPKKTNPTNQLEVPVGSAGRGRRRGNPTVGVRTDL